MRTGGDQDLDCQLPRAQDEPIGVWAGEAAGLRAAARASVAGRQEEGKPGGSVGRGRPFTWPSGQPSKSRP